MKHILVSFFICAISCNAYGMKRPPEQSICKLEPAQKKTKFASPAMHADYPILTPAEQQNRIIIGHLNEALTYIDHAQNAVERSNTELIMRISQMHQEVAHAQNFVTVLEKYQEHIDKLFVMVHKTQNHLTHYLENTKKNVVDITFDVAFNKQAVKKIPEIAPNTLLPVIDVETLDEPVAQNVDTLIEVEDAYEVYTAMPVPQKQPRPRSKK